MRHGLSSGWPQLTVSLQRRCSAAVCFTDNNPWSARSNLTRLALRAIHPLHLWRGLCYSTVMSSGRRNTDATLRAVLALPAATGCPCLPRRRGRCRRAANLPVWHSEKTRRRMRWKTPPQRTVHGKAQPCPSAPSRSLIDATGALFDVIFVAPHSVRL